MFAPLKAFSTKGHMSSKRHRCIDEGCDIEISSCNKRSLTDRISEISFQTENECQLEDKQDDDICRQDDASITHMTYSNEDNIQPCNSFGPELPAVVPNFSLGKSSFSRKVDLLIDEVIRKSRQKFSHSSFESEMDAIPSSVGPHPLTDHALSVSFPLQLILLSSRGEDKRSKNVLSSSGEIDQVTSFQVRRDSMDEYLADCNRCGSYESKNIGEREVKCSTDSSMKIGEVRASHSGSVTHSDWVIEEVSFHIYFSR